MLSLECSTALGGAAFSSKPMAQIDSGKISLEQISLEQISLEQMRKESMTERSHHPITALNQLTGTEWLLEDLGGAGVIDNLQTTLRFDEPNHISGRGGCNRYTGSAQWTGDTAESFFTVSAVASTRMMGTPAAMNQERRYFQALKNAERIKLDGPYLLIQSQGNTAPLRFTQLQANAPSSPAENTLVAFEGRKNAVRIFTQNGQTLMNVYNKQDGITWMRATAVTVEQTAAGTRYTNTRGESKVVVFVPRSGEPPRLTINGKVDH